MEEKTKEFLDRFKAEVEGLGKSLRQMDDVLAEGLRHKFHKGSKRPLWVDDYFRGTAALELDPFRLLARIAGYGDPFDITALRGSRAPVWPAEQKRILDSLEDLKRAGGDGFEEIREDLRRLELLADNDFAGAEREVWYWLAEERRPGAVVGLLSFLAVDATRTKAHFLLALACKILGERQECAAGGKLAAIIGQCFIKVEFPREGLQILKNQALPIATIYGDNEDIARILYHLSRAASRTGDEVMCKRALKRASFLSKGKLNFAANQLLAHKELSTGSPETAFGLYDELISHPDFEKTEKTVGRRRS